MACEPIISDGARRGARKNHYHQPQAMSKLTKLRQRAINPALFLVAAFAGSLCAAQAGLIGFYSFDNPGDPYADDSGNGKTLTGDLAGPESNPVYAADGGVEGGAFLYYGTNRLSAPININPDVLPQMTMGAWVRTATLTPGIRSVLSHDDGALDRRVGLETRFGPFRYSAFAGFTFPIPSTAFPSSTNDWTFLAVTYDQTSGQMALYCDLDSMTIGDALEVFSADLVQQGNGFPAVVIGALRPTSSGEGWLGAIDNVFFYDEVLLPDQLEAIRTGGKRAIIGSGESPDLRLTARPVLDQLPKSPAAIAFTVEVRNVSPTRSMTIGDVAVAGVDAGSFTITSFPSVIPASGAGLIEGAFHSQGQAGTRNAELIIQSDDPSTPRFVMPFAAVVAADPSLAVAATSDWSRLPRQAAPHDLVFGVTNSGYTQTLHLQQILLSGPDAPYYAVQTFPAQLAPGEGGELVIRLTSQDQVGAFTALATIQSDGESQPQILLDLSTHVTNLALIAFYPFDDAANPLLDASGNGLTLVGAGGFQDPTWNSGGGMSGSCFEFDGGQRFTAPLNINPDVMPLLTMGAWVRCGALDPGNFKVIGHDDGANDRVIGLDTRVSNLGGPMPAGTWRYTAFTGDTTMNGTAPVQMEPVPAPLGPEVWTFIAAVYDQINGTMTFHVDLDASTTSEPPQSQTVITSMGPGYPTTAVGALRPTATLNDPWVGSIDNVFFLSGAAAAGEIRTIRDGGVAALLELRADPLPQVTNSLSFGTVATGAALTNELSILNHGITRPLNIAEVRLSGRDAARFSVGALPAPIPPGGAASLQVGFDSRGFEGRFDAVLEIISDAGTDRRLVVALDAFVPFANTVVAFYPFDDPVNPLRDVSGHGKNLTQVAGAVPTFDASGGFEGGTFHFSGTQRLISPVDINPTVLPKLTMGAWVKTASLANGLRDVMGADNGGYDRCIGLDNRPGGTPFRYTTWRGGSNQPLEGTPSPISTNDWTFLAVSYDEAVHALTMYVDLDASTIDDPLVEVSSPTPTAFNASFNTTSIGNYRPTVSGNGWVGSIDNVFFISRTLTTEEITRIRDEGAKAIVASLFRATASRVPGRVDLVWDSATQNNYAVQYTSQLGLPWTTIATVPGEAGHTGFGDTDATRLSRPQGYYRVELLPRDH